VANYPFTLRIQVFWEFGWSGGCAVPVVFSFSIWYCCYHSTRNCNHNEIYPLEFGLISIVCTIFIYIIWYVMTGLANYTEFKIMLHQSCGYCSYSIHKMASSSCNNGYFNRVYICDIGGFIRQSHVFFFSMSKDGLLPKNISDLLSKLPHPLQIKYCFMCFTSLRV
jgi:hypothetical protein